MHQSPPTAKGHHFITLEDEYGVMISVIVRPKIYERYRTVLRGNRLLVVEGEVQQKGGVTNIIARRGGSLERSGQLNVDASKAG